jgi:hypothetical protein
VDASAASERTARGKLLDSYWFRGAMLVAFVEGILVAVDVIPRWVAVVIAVPVIAGYFLRGRKVRDPSRRQVLWALAFSQAIVLLVPLITWIIGAVAVVVAAVVAAIVIFALIIDR